MNTFVAAHVFLSQAYHLAAHQYLMVGVGSGQADLLGGAQYAVGAGVDSRDVAANLVGCGKAVEQHLPETQCALAAVQFFPVLTRSASGRTVGAFPAVAAGQINRRVISCPCSPEVFFR